jgi:hypothetical protein
MLVQASSLGPHYVLGLQNLGYRSPSCALKHSEDLGKKPSST